jgi:MFS family permease
LKTMEAGTGLPRMLLMYMVFNLTTSILSTPLGSLSDRIGRKRIILAGYLLYAIVYLMFGFITSSMKDLLWVFWALYGVYYALTEGVEKALVADLAPKEKKGTVMGFFNTITGVGLLPASLIAGFLYSYSPVYPFVFGGATALAAFVIILFFLKEQRVNG